MKTYQGAEQDNLHVGDIVALSLSSGELQYEIFALASSTRGGEQAMLVHNINGARVVRCIDCYKLYSKKWRIASLREIIVSKRIDTANVMKEISMNSPWNCSANAKCYSLLSELKALENELVLLDSSGPPSQEQAA